MKNVIQRSLKSPDAILSMIIGLAVVLAIGFAIINSIKSSNVKKQEEIKKAEEQAKLDAFPKEHVTKEGENLWVISETYYKTGYNWVDIATANTITDPDLIYPEQKLTIPDVKPRLVEEGQIASGAATEKPKHSTYTVVSGDTLWDIAMKEYNDNYRWPDIASTNQIPNPDLIFPDTILKLN